MAWKDTLLDASFKGVKFECLSTQDDATHDTADHEYAYVDGADVEDLGLKARRIDIAAIFYGDDYEERLQAFIKVFDEHDAGELIHPVFGSIKTAQPLRRTIRHEADNVDQCTIDLSFVESTPGNPFFDRALPAQKAADITAKGEMSREVLAGGLDGLMDQIKMANPLSGLPDLGSAMSLPILSGISQIQGVMTSGLDFLSMPRAFCGDLSSMVDGALGIVSAGKGFLSGFAAYKSVLGIFDAFKFSGGKSSSKSTPAAPVFNAGVPSQAQAVNAVKAHISAQTAIGEANAVGQILESESDKPTLSPPEIESITNSARESIDEAIEAIRQTYPMETARTMIEAMKDQALAVQESAQAVIEARPPLILRQVPASGNLHLLAHLWYADHTRADELLRLNPGLRSPNFIKQGDRLYGFAE